MNFSCVIPVIFSKINLGWLVLFQVRLDPWQIWLILFFVSYDLEAWYVCILSNQLLNYDSVLISFLLFINMFFFSSKNPKPVNNSLTGSFPTEIELLPSLEWLWLSKCCDYINERKCIKSKSSLFLCLLIAIFFYL